MRERNWSLGEAAFGWPDDVDRTGTDQRSGYRYVPLWQCDRQLGYQVARIYLDEGDQEMAADAQLIAAAPDLLAALRHAVMVMQHYDIDEHLAGEFEIFTDAIAKAEGRAE